MVDTRLFDADFRFAPTPIIISGDESVQGEIKRTPDGRVETTFAERLVFVANHLVPVNHGFG